MADGSVSLPYASAGIKALFDFSYEQLQADARLLFSKVHPDDIAGVYESIQFSYKHLTPWQHECRIIFDDATTKYLLASSIPEKDPDGSVLWNGFVSDITQKKLADEKIEIAKKGFKTMFECNAAMIVLLDPLSKRIVNANPAAAAFYGYTTDEMRGMPAGNITQLSEAELEELLDDTLNNNKKYVVAPHRLANGEMKLVEIMTSPIDFGTHKILFSILNDVTEKVAVEKALASQNEELKRSNDDLSNFAALASHDLKEPLRMVTSFLTLLRKRLGPELDEHKSKYIFYALDGTERMRKQINGLLYYSRVSNNKEAFAIIDLNETLTNFPPVLRSLVNTNHAVIKVHYLPQISGNTLMIRELFFNLISNAIKYTGNKTPHIEIGFKEDTDFNRFYVRDNGIGVSVENFENIFRMFQHGRKEGEYVGTGIGLALCKRIVVLHGGQVWVESGEGPGSTFWFTIPKRQ